MDLKQINRWNIILGEAECSGGEAEGLGNVLSFVYDSDSDERHDRAGGKGKTLLTVPEWLKNAKELLPPRGFDILTKHAIKKYNLTYLLGEDEVLDSIKPDIDILRQILTFKNALNKDKTEKLKRIVREVAEELSKKIKQEVSPALFGARRSFLRGYAKRLKNLNIKATIKRNLKTYDAASSRIYPDRLIFNGNQNRRMSKKLVLLVDQSGSMTDSVINTALLAGILCKTGFLDLSLAVFDTSIVDLTDKCNDVTELLLSVQLGGGTDVGKALTYANSIITSPRDTIVVLISDLCDGFGYSAMYAAASSILLSGAKLLCLTAMGWEKAVYDERAASKLMAMGAAVSAKTPGELCDWIIKEIN